MTKTLRLTALAIAFAGIGGAATLLYENGKKNDDAFLQQSNIPALHTSYTSSVPGAVVDFEKAAAAAVPSVVHIKTLTKFRQTGGQSPEQDPFGGQGGDFFRHFFGDGGTFSQPQQDQRASGSGVIISPDGYIVTNNHVVDGATQITVTLDDRKDYKAKVIGTDANTDLALIKIDANNLPVMAMGNSDDAKLGEWVLAIGYPLNLDVTVTEGIISAKSRNIGINTKGSAPVESFIQTDAAVNPGSSGGALIDANGQLIGINSAIASPTGSYAGYAYSIPVNLVRKVVGDLMKYGMVQRGYLGISMAPEQMDDAKKKELGINDDVNGVWIVEVSPNSAAAEAGLKKGDAILKVDDVATATPSELAELIARKKPGDNVQITYLRDGKENTVSVTLKNKMGTFASQENAAIQSLGADFAALSANDAKKMGIDGGVQVTNIHDGIISNETNMRDGFVITKIGNQSVKTVDDLKNALSDQSSNFQIQGMYPGSAEIYYYGLNDFRK
ncbi:MAG TPA: trypsin-like peptidase domain-containing protein [Chitinophagaceae bacterium]|nr:trypsin-like peptidase domain-containing protein [Chitinophagaceae bacterium]